jgi:hypothetical protein
MSTSPFSTATASLDSDLLDEFGLTVTYEQAPVSAFTITALWYEKTGEPTTARFRLSDFPLVLSGDRMVPRIGDTVTYSTRVFEVREKPIHDGIGGVTVELRVTGRVIS